MREGSLDAPTRHQVDWQNPDFHDEAKLDAEMRRVFDICHGCRRCFNLCDSFPRLFDLIDATTAGEIEAVKSSDFRTVADACTLCDMCFMTKCPYVPPHTFDLDFPHLMLRYRIVEAKKSGVPLPIKILTNTDLAGGLARHAPALVNWGSATGNALTRPLMEKTLGVDRNAALPRFHGKTFVLQATDKPPALNASAPAHGRKAVLYATCSVNYNTPGMGMKARSILAHNGVATSVLYPSCCGMPQLEQGDVENVVAKAAKVAAAFLPLIDQGHDVVVLTPSCALMLKFEWPLLVPKDHPARAAVERLSKATFDISEYIVAIARKEGLAPGLKPLPEAGQHISLHMACHARAQNVGQKAAELLRLIPGATIDVTERCSGHGGSWGIMKGNFETALKVGKPAARQMMKTAPAYIASECPLAATHIAQGIERLEETKDKPMPHNLHPIDIFALAYGLAGETP